jgi:MFS family permease
VGLSQPQEVDESDSDYNKRLNLQAGYVFIALGVSQAIFGIMLNLFGERFCKFKMLVSGTVLVELSCFISFLCFYFESYPLCFVISFLWGGCDTFIQTNMGAVISALFPGKVESFSVFRIFFALGVVTTVVLNLALDGTPLWIFLVIVMGFQMFYTLISIKVL